MSWNKKGFWLLWGFKVQRKIDRAMKIIEKQGHPKNSAAWKNKRYAIIKDETRELIREKTIKDPIIYWQGEWLVIKL